MWGDPSLVLLAVCLLSWIPPCMCHSAPDMPKILRCRSPEKETFTCWWEPGSDGGLPTTYRLFYRKERSEKVFECPDYHRGGNNSCFFDKAHTSIWVIYNITVMASNAYGSTFSEPVEVDVMDIVQPYSPENVTLTLMGTEDSPYFLAQWEAPRDTDTRSGWVTVKYEIGVKLENGRQDQDNEWEVSYSGGFACACGLRLKVIHRHVHCVPDDVYSAGKQRELRIYSPQPGGRYIVRARCKLDQGLWSEWSPPMFIQIPDNSLTERSVMIFAASLGAFVFLAAVGMLAVKRNRVKRCLLPPVPGPKIKGFDNQLLKTETSKDILDPLTSQGFLTIPDCNDQVEYVVVIDCEDDIEESRSQTQEHQQKNQCFTENGFHYCIHLSTVETKLKITESDKWKRPDVTDEEYKPESTDEASQTHCLSAHDRSQPDLHPNRNYSIKFHKDMIRNFHSRLEYVDEKERRDCKPTLQTEEGEDYSRVSGVYRDSILMLQKDSVSIPECKGKNCDDLNKKTTQKTSTHNDVRDSQEYVETMATL